MLYADASLSTSISNVLLLVNCRVQSFTPLKADLRQEINGGFAFIAGAFREYFVEGSAPLRLW